jgi:uncharacterized protein (TIGR00369 family)
MTAAIPPDFMPIAHSGRHQSFEHFVGPIYHVPTDSTDRVRFGFLVEARHTNPYGMLHGGMLTTVVDTMMGWLVFHALKGGPCATINLNCDFISSARTGDWVEGDAQVTRMGRQVAFVRARVNCGERALLTASGSWAILEAKK